MGIGVIKINGFTVLPYLVICMFYAAKKSWKHLCLILDSPFDQNMLRQKKTGKKLPTPYFVLTFFLSGSKLYWSVPATIFLLIPVLVKFTGNFLNLYFFFSVWSKLFSEIDNPSKAMVSCKKGPDIKNSLSQKSKYF